MTMEHRAWRTTLTILNRRVQSEAMLRKKLEGKGFEIQAIDGAVDKAKQFKLLDDKYYGEAMIRSEAAKGRGRQRIQASLERHGIGKELAAEVISTFGLKDPDKEFDRAQAALKKKLSRNAKITRENALRFLLRQGFAFETALKALKSQNFNPQETDAEG